MRVSVFLEKGGGICDASCGMDWSLPENRQLAVQRLKDRFGPKAAIEFVELSDPARAHEYSEVRDRIRREHLYLPLLMVGGTVKVAGPFDLRMLSDMVETEIERQEDIW